MNTNLNLNLLKSNYEFIEFIGRNFDETHFPGTSIPPFVSSSDEAPKRIVSEYNATKHKWVRIEKPIIQTLSAKTIRQQIAKQLPAEIQAFIATKAEDFS